MKIKFDTIYKKYTIHDDNDVQIFGPMLATFIEAKKYLKSIKYSPRIIRLPRRNKR